VMPWQVVVTVTGGWILDLDEIRIVEVDEWVVVVKKVALMVVIMVMVVLLRVLGRRHCRL
jgi:hypothetical protein